MADLKISQLSDGGASQATDEYVIARSGANYRIDGASVAAAATSVGTLTSLTVSGNITASGGAVLKGITNGTSGLGIEVGTSAGGILRAFNRTTLAYGDMAIDGLTLALQGATGGATTVGGSLTVTSNLAVDTNTLYVDAANNRVGVGTASPGSKLEVAGDAAFKVASGNVGYSLISGSTAVSVYLEDTDDSLRIYSGTTDKVILSSSGNLGLGVTPSAWSGMTALQVKNAAIWQTGNDAGMVNNAFFNGTNWKYLATAGAALYQTVANVHQWYNAASGTAGNNITFTQAMTLDASGNLGLGLGSTAIAFENGGGQVIYNSTVPRLALRNSTTGTTGFDGTDLAVVNSDCYLFNRESGAVIFGTNGSERARITSGGRLLVGTTTENTSGGVIQVSNGITFPATQSASSDANTLDDYEEGSWTPTYGGSTTNPTVTYSDQFGRYVKIGRLVWVHWIMGTNSVSGGSGAVIVEGLPFAINQDGSFPIYGNVVGEVLSWASNEPTKMVANPDAYSTTALVCSPTQVSDMSTSSPNYNRLRASMMYYTAG